MMPSLFISHGSPMIAIENTDYTRYLAQLGQRLKPKAIVLFTAHWESEVTQISAMDTAYETIYDFGGFPDELYAVKYPAVGSTEVAALVQQQLQSNGIPSVLDSKRGLDHGTWTVLHLMYPQADIPVVQVSVNPYASPKQQLALGAALQSLGEQDILVIGSGATVHNLRALRWGQQQPEAWAVEFDDWLLANMAAADADALDRYVELAPHARLAVPRAEHFVPALIAMGSGKQEKPTEVLYRGYDLGTLSYLVLEF